MIALLWFNYLHFDNTLCLTCYFQGRWFCTCALPQRIFVKSYPRTLPLIWDRVSQILCMWNQLEAQHIKHDVSLIQVAVQFTMLNTVIFICIIKTSTIELLWLMQLWVLQCASATHQRTALFEHVNKDFPDFGNPTERKADCLFPQHT